MSKRLLGIGDVYTYDYKQVHKTRNVGFGYYDPNKVSTTSSTDGYVLVDGVLSVVNEDGSSEPGPGPGPEPSLPPFTLRLKFKDGVTPELHGGSTLTQVSSNPNVWDFTYTNTNWSVLFEGQNDLLEVIDGNTTGVTNMVNMFGNCYSLTSVCMLDTSVCTDMGGMFSNCSELTTVPLFDTSNVTNIAVMFMECHSLTSVPLFNTSSVTSMEFMFYNCDSLTYIPLFNTTNVRNMDCMFANCVKVESGALALYTQASTQANTPDHTDTFLHCGDATMTGHLELEEIPEDWGGMKPPEP